MPSRPRVTRERGSFISASVAAPSARQLGEILADGDVMKRLQLRFVGCGRCDASFRVGVKIVARVERYGRRAFLPRNGLAHQRWSGDAKAIIGNG